MGERGRRVSSYDGIRIIPNIFINSPCCNTCVFMAKKRSKTEKEWQEVLTTNEFRVLRGKGTERAFSGKYLAAKEKGVYVCAGCGNELFTSDAKFDSGSGWPSFRTLISRDRVTLKDDRSHGMKRTEVMCSCCGGHLGHVFNDGTPPTGLRFCINSMSLHFKKSK